MNLYEFTVKTIDGQTETLDIRRAEALGQP